MIIGLVLFAILGLTMGYTVSGAGAWFALLAPILFAAFTAFATGLDGGQIVTVLVALAITAGAVLLGKLLDGQLTRSSEQSS